MTILILYYKNKKYEYIIKLLTKILFDYLNYLRPQNTHIKFKCNYDFRKNK